jgi:ADP-ribosylglycohydrolase
MPREYVPSEEDRDLIARARERHESLHAQPSRPVARPEKWNQPIGLNDKYEPFRVHGRGREFQPQFPSWPDAVLGMMVGGAVGDALGNPVEFLGIDAIRQHYGPAGISSFPESPGVITDDTQMSLFTLEALIEADLDAKAGGTTPVGDFLRNAYLRWWATQREESLAADKPGWATGWLFGVRELWVRRAPGNTCLSALRSIAHGGPVGTVERPINDSKGCGGVMRAAPAALWGESAADAFRLGAQAAAVTHGHPSGYLSAGLLAHLVRDLLERATWAEAVEHGRAELVRWAGHEEQLAALDAAVELAAAGPPGPETIAARLGGGWVGEEALAIAVCAALSAEAFEDGVVVAVNHSGDSDSTGAIAGNLLGAYHGAPAVPARWWDGVELRRVIEVLTADAITGLGEHAPNDPRWSTRYR